MRAKRSIQARREELMRVALEELEGYVQYPLLWSYLFADMALLLPVRLTGQRLSKMVKSLRAQCVKLDHVPRPRAALEGGAT